MEIEQIFQVPFHSRENVPTLLRILHLEFLSDPGKVVLDYLLVYNQQTFSPNCVRYDACRILDVHPSRYSLLARRPTIFIRLDTLVVVYHPSGRKRSCFDFLFIVPGHRQNKDRGDRFYLVGEGGKTFYSTLCSFNRFGLSADPEKFLSEKRQSWPCPLPLSSEQQNEIKQGLEIFQALAVSLKFTGRMPKFRQCAVCEQWIPTNLICCYS